MSDFIKIRGAKQHNLKNIDLELPRQSLIVFTGLSGSGKSSLAFDTIYAEGQRRYIESLSAYARQFLGQMERPEVESIEGLSPAISIDQKGVSRNPRSTVATVTEIYDYFRLLYARIGVAYCPNDGQRIVRLTTDEIVNQLFRQSEQELKKTGQDSLWLTLYAPIAIERKGEFHQILYDLYSEGYTQARVDGQFVHLRDKVELGRYQQHNIDIVIDEMAIPVEYTNQSDLDEQMTRLTEAVETATQLTKRFQLNSIQYSFGERETATLHTVSTEYTCHLCGYSLGEVNPRLFSFNSPVGACPDCHGLGVLSEFDPELLVPDQSLSIMQGGIMPDHYSQDKNNYYSTLINSIANHFNIRLDQRIKDLPAGELETILHGRGREKIAVRFIGSKLNSHFSLWFDGLINLLKRRHESTGSESIREELNLYMSQRPCESCQGHRLRQQALAIKLGSNMGDTASPADLSISELTQLSVDQAILFFGQLKLTDRQRLIAEAILREINNRLSFLANVGLNYLNLERRAGTLSGGEAQRIRLASQIGSGLAGVLYVLDEPTIGLHQRDNARLIQTLVSLRDLGNTIIVVEHDEETIRAADHIVDIGPAAGVHGGQLLHSGPLGSLLPKEQSSTANYLSRRLTIALPERRRRQTADLITIEGATEHNLKNLTVSFPIKNFIAVTGVSGSGKSTLVNDILFKAVSQKINRNHQRSGKHRQITGLKLIDKIIGIDQSPIGRTPRSNPATYTGAFTPIRELLAATDEARIRGYAPGRFSFNVSGGRCEACQGNGTVTIEMHFLPDLEVMCEICKGRRYNRETLEVKYQELSIADILDLTIDQALERFVDFPAIADKLASLQSVGLGYIKLGQSATTLSGGEAQRVKLATELAKRPTGHTLYILDEPTTGLHFADIAQLLIVLNRLVDRGNTVVVIEHNLDVIKTADYIIDLGPEGGEHGGQLVAAGTPEEVAKVSKSLTGQYLVPLLQEHKQTLSRSRQADSQRLASPNLYNKK
ncbi:MAG: excinuclease ABC subunit A [Candidatus Berkelbacteria bacterium Gr01-1014_85]|uniref:UvrABC system protein A n=1 Tax=Candidatus Berkelbacteria bacterium Gr01-1014_85 TaxID=2017150 RepID=A0A554JDI4_9BACT|nr:MAG: excinuclease ABC subunit A [Candidatus Berkelbacteria bacterium Gr01-1014_85]